MKYNELRFNFYNNIKFFSRYNIYEINNGDQHLKNIELAQWHIKDKYNTGLNVLDLSGTVKLLTSKPKSFCRLGMVN